MSTKAYCRYRYPFVTPGEKPGIGLWDALTSRPYLMALDLLRMDGREVLKAFRSDQSLRLIPIIACRLDTLRS